MAREYHVISGDSHVEVHSDQWINRVPAAYRDRAPRVIRLQDGSDAWLVEGQPLREIPTDLYGGKPLETYRPLQQNYETTPGTGPATQRLHEQDLDGIDAEVLFPGVSGPGLWRGIRDDEAYKAVVRAFNDFLAEDYCSVDRERLLGLGVVPWTGVLDAVAEMEHCAAKGLRGVALGVFPSGRGYPTPQDDRFWSAALDLDMPVAVHVQLDRTGPRSGPLVSYPRQDPQLMERIGPRREFARKLTDFAYGGAENAIQMILDGVFDRFPKLKIFFAENQIGWIPVFNYSADFRYRRHRFWAEDLRGLKPLARPPSEYIREHCYWGFQYDRVGVELRDRIGVDRVIWATDFPHQDCEYPHSLRAIERDFAGVPEQEKYQMVCGNVIDFFHLDAARSVSAASAI